MMGKDKPLTTHYSYREADYTIISSDPDRAQYYIAFYRDIIEEYTKENPRFLKAMGPITISAPVHPIIQRMVGAAAAAGVGPMAAVAGAIAEFAVRSVVEGGAADANEECIIDNGGDIYISSPRTITVGIYAGENALSGKIGFSIPASAGPIGLCSSSSFLGHSRSFGSCDLATVFSPDCALADAAATWGCNKVATPDDLGPVSEAVAAIEGITGAVIIKGEAVAIAGDIPELVPIYEADIVSKITRHPASRS
jgi:uncharacterized protein